MGCDFGQSARCSRSRSGGRLCATAHRGSRDGWLGRQRGVVVVAAARGVGAVVTSEKLRVWDVDRQEDGGLRGAQRGWYGTGGHRSG
jgi:hypothetical protein